MNLTEQLKEEIKNKSTINNDGCWIWNRYYDAAGYGAFALRGRKNEVKDYFSRYATTMILAHKAAWIIWNGDIPDDKQVIHTCGRKDCVNPKHLRLATWKEIVEIQKYRGIRPQAIRKQNHRTEDVKCTIRAKILHGDSFYSISKMFGIHVSVVRDYAKALENQIGKKMPQRA